MLRKQILLLVPLTLVALAFFSATTTQAQTIDFEALRVDGTSDTFMGPTYTEDGFTLTTSGSSGYGSANNASVRYAGSTSLFDNGVNGMSTLTRIGGGAFNVTSIDLVSLNGLGGNTSGTATFTGFFSGGGSITQSFTYGTVDLANHTGFQTFFFNGFTNITSLQFQQTSPFFQFDNIVLNGNITAMPEPATMLLLIISMVGIGMTAIRGKRKNGEVDQEE